MMEIQKMINTMVPPIALKASAKLAFNIKRHTVRRKLSGQERLHLACGNNVLEGWANIDFRDNKQVVGWDLTHDLPVHTETIALIFCEHFIEHITRKQAKSLLNECYRCLRTGGIIRLSTPSLKKIVGEYLSRRLSEWHDVGFVPATPCQMVNDGLRLWGHQFVYDEEELKLLLEETGFQDIALVEWRESTIPELRNLECRPFHAEIILEARK